jgi:hypothetical protein
MTANIAQAETLRHRNVSTHPQGPPVPPKLGYLSHGEPQQRSLQTPRFAQSSKVLPPIPPHRSEIPPGPEDVYSKPLPQPPPTRIFKTILTWIFGFLIWFLLIVILLPIITEQDAMPSFNGWLRSLFLL